MAGNFQMRGKTVSPLSELGPWKVAKGSHTRTAREHNDAGLAIALPNPDIHRTNFTVTLTSDGSAPQARSHVNAGRARERPSPRQHLSPSDISLSAVSGRSAFADWPDLHRVGRFEWAARTMPTLPISGHPAINKRRCDFRQVDGRHQRSRKQLLDSVCHLLTVLCR
jgi:hypothetical protein